jgi:UrcA family protein
MLRMSLVIAAAVVGASAAQAREPARTPTEIRLTQVVDFHDAGQVQALHLRLGRAARAACDSGMGRDLGAALADARCARDSLDRAVARLDQPTLTALHQGGRLPATPVRLAAAEH